MLPTHEAAVPLAVPLRSAHVCVSAHLSGSQYLRWADALTTVLKAVIEWQMPTVHVAVITNNVSAARRMLLERGLSPADGSSSYARSRDIRPMTPNGAVGPLSMRDLSRASAAFPLTWYHRAVWAERFYDSANSYDVFAYLEHDMLLEWEQLKAWAADEAILARAPLPHGALVPWKRGFYRWYVRYRRGVDTSMSHRVRMQSEAERFMVDGNPCLPPARLARCRLRVGHATFVGLANPYSATSVLTRSRLALLLSSDQWLPNKVLARAPARSAPADATSAQSRPAVAVAAGQLVHAKRPSVDRPARDCRVRRRLPQLHARLSGRSTHRMQERDARAMCGRHRPNPHRASVNAAKTCRSLSKVPTNLSRRLTLSSGRRPNQQRRDRRACPRGGFATPHAALSFPAPCRRLSALRSRSRSW